MFRHLTLGAVACLLASSAVLGQPAPLEISPRTTLVITKPGPDWQHMPTLAELKATEPAVTGPNLLISMRCGVRKDGSLEGCHPEREPPSSPLAQAARKLLPSYRLSEHDAVNVLRQGGELKFDIVWRMLCDPSRCVITPPAPPSLAPGR